MRRFIFSAPVFLLTVLLTDCAHVTLPRETEGEAQPRSTFAKFLRLAEAGDAKSQNLIGFMLYFGEGVRKDRDLAHRWFHRAADQGHVGAQINLAVMHYLGYGGAKDLEEAKRFFRLAKKNGSLSRNESAKFALPDNLADLAERVSMRPQNTDARGEATYAIFCAGCHGLNGIAAYVRAPSFALGERMDKSDEQLFHTITHGHGTMPAWRDKLSDESLIEALQFVRTLPQQYQNGIAQVLRTPPSLYFLFGPMSTDPVGIYQDYMY